jgi:TonB family protein
MDRNLTTGLVVALGAYALAGWQVAALRQPARVAVVSDPTPAETRSFQVPPLRQPQPPPPDPEVVHELPSAQPPPAPTKPPPRAAKRTDRDDKPATEAQKAIENPDPAPGGQGPALEPTKNAAEGPAAPVLDPSGQGGGEPGKSGQGQGDRTGDPDGDPNAVYGANVVDAVPKLLKQVRPDYPEWALRDGATAAFSLTYVVTAEGTVRDLQIKCLRGACELASTIQAVARKWRFTPGQKAGRAVATRVTQEFEFHIDAEEE